MKHSRETKGTHVYANEADDAVIPTLYIKKSAFEKDKEPPATITVDIKELK